MLSTVTGTRSTGDSSGSWNVNNNSRVKPIDQTCPLFSCEEIGRLVCSACKQVSYCSKEHQQMHWKLAHKEECKQLQQANKETTEALEKKETSSLSQEIDKTCRFCKTRGLTTQACSGCRTVYYCSREHQKQDWKEHKKECTQLKEKKQEQFYKSTVQVNQLMDNWTETAKWFDQMDARRKMAQTPEELDALQAEIEKDAHTRQMSGVVDHFKDTMKDMRTQRYPDNPDLHRTVRAVDKHLKPLYALMEEAKKGLDKLHPEDS